jgi:nicotinamidase-related amidase
MWTMRKRRQGTAGLAILAVAGLALGFDCVVAKAQDILQEWATIKPPPPPEIKPVALDAKTTAVIVMDFNQRNCIPAQRSRCAVVLPKVQKLLAEARAKSMLIVHTYTPNMQQADISKDVTPAAGERVLQVRGDKFHGNDLEKYLKDKTITTILLVGTSANGAVLFTAIGGSQRGFKVVVPIDAMPADTAYQEQFAIWEIANGPGVREDSTLTKLDLLTF